MNLSNMNLSKIAAAIMLGVGGCLALHYGETEIAASAFGFLGGWLLRNGVNNARNIK